MFPEHKRFLIVDGHAFAYRAFHAIRNLSAPDGRPTNAIFGFIKTLDKLVNLWRPEYQAVFWDGGLAPERMATLPEYKAQRPPMPEGLASQLDGMMEYLGAMGVASFCRDQVEADDWIATAARQAVEQGAHVIIASADKDFMQLVSPVVGLVNPNDKTERIWDAPAVLEKSGVRPEQIVDWLSLIGDSVDNIPGVPGVGPKTAADLLAKYGTVNALYSLISQVASVRIKNALLESESIVRRNQQLIRLNDRVLPEPFVLESVKPGSKNDLRLRVLFTQWGFKKMMQEYRLETLGQTELF